MCNCVYNSEKFNEMLLGNRIWSFEMGSFRWPQTVTQNSALNLSTHINIFALCPTVRWKLSFYNFFVCGWTLPNHVVSNQGWTMSHRHTFFFWKWQIPTCGWTECRSVHMCEYFIWFYDSVLSFEVTFTSNFWLYERTEGYFTSEMGGQLGKAKTSNRWNQNLYGWNVFRWGKPILWFKDWTFPAFQYFFSVRFKIIPQYKILSMGILAGKRVSLIWQQIHRKF